MPDATEQPSLSRRRRREFTATWLMFFVVAGVVTWYRFDSWPLGAVLGVVGLLVPLMSLVSPRHVAQLYGSMMWLQRPINRVASTVLLTLVYVCLVTPIGVLLRSRGRDPLKRNFDSQTESYWSERAPLEGPDCYFRQF